MAQISLTFPDGNTRVFDAGVTAAEQTLADRRQFVLDETQWQAFQEALDRPVQNKTRLKSLLREPGVLG